MVMGSGMMAEAFKQYKDDKNIVIFASGVSNSQKHNFGEFQREINLLKENIDSRKMIYFSTVSIFDSSLKNSKYISHKLYIENLIQENCENYLIFRLPNVIGETSNKNTFFNFIKNKIINNEELVVQKNAYRYFIDVEDLVKILPIIISNDNKKRINACFDNKIHITQMIKLFEDILEIKANKTFSEKGCNYIVDNSYLLNVTEKNNISIDNEYIKKIIIKYLKKF